MKLFKAKHGVQVKADIMGAYYLQKYKINKRCVCETLCPQIFDL